MDKNNTLQIAVLTLLFGTEEFALAVRPALRSKERYCQRYHHDFIKGGSEWHRPHQPVLWTKLLLLAQHLPKYNWIWVSDADGAQARKTETAGEIRVCHVILRLCIRVPQAGGPKTDSCGFTKKRPEGP